MAWDIITDAEVTEELTPQETATLNGIQGATTQLGNILNRVVNSVRGSILAGGGRVGLDMTVPDQLRPDVIDIARWRFLTAFPALKSLQTAARKDAADAAQKRIDKVAAGELKVELPDSADAQSTTAPNNAAQFSAANRVATGTKLNGLT